MKKIVILPKDQLDIVNSDKCYTLAYKIKAKLFMLILKNKGYKAWLSNCNCIMLDSNVPNRIAKKIGDLAYLKGVDVDIY